MFVFDAHTCDFVAGSVMSIRNYFRPSNGLSESTGSISIALKSREQGTSNPLCARSAEYFLRPCIRECRTLSGEREQAMHCGIELICS